VWKGVCWEGREGGLYCTFPCTVHSTGSCAWLGGWACRATQDAVPPPRWGSSSHTATSRPPVPVGQLVGGDVAADLRGLRQPDGCDADEEKDVEDHEGNRPGDAPAREGGMSGHGGHP
jgi:hypothetical protein